IERFVDLLKKIRIRFSDADSKSHASGWKLDVLHLRSGGIIQRDRSVHDDCVETVQREIDEGLHLAVVTSDVHASESLNIPFRKRYLQHADAATPQVFHALNSVVVDASGECQR